MEPNGDVINGEVRLGPTNAFEGLRISSSEFLNDVDERMICSKCFRSRKYFCYTCYTPMDTIKDKLPHVHLPVQIDILKYPKEVDGKSTATHATILAPENTTIYTYPNFPEFKDKTKVLVVFPGKNSITLEDLARKLRNCQADGINSVCLPNQDKGCERCTSNKCSSCTLAPVPVNSTNAVLNFNCEDSKSLCSHSVPNCKCNETLKVYADAQPLKPGHAVSEPVVNSPSDVHCNCSTTNCIHVEATSTQKLRLKSKSCDYTETVYPRDNLELHCVVENVSSEFSGLHICDHPKTQKNYAEQLPFERIIFIDSTWNQVHKINNDERLDGIQRVEIKSRDSLFWRFQRGKPRTYLATIEAIYYFLVDMHVTFLHVPYNGEYDNLLFFFRFMYEKIHKLYGHRPLRAYSKNATKNPPHKIARLF